MTAGMREQSARRAPQGYLPRHTVSGPTLADFGLARDAVGVSDTTGAAADRSPTSLELFAGGGGMALGMRAAGFAHHALVEWWAPAATVLRHNAAARPDLWTPDQVVEDDVRKVIGDFGDGGVDLVAGGPPCQPFSFGGAHAGDTDERNMFPAAIATVRKLRPKLVVFENVPGLRRPSFAPYLDYVKAQLRHPDVTPRDGELWSEHYARVLATRQDPLYRVYEDLIDAADLGVPQNRRRVFLIAIHRELPGADTWVDVPRTHDRDVLLHQQYVTGEYWRRHGLDMPEVPLRQRGHVRRLQSIGVPDGLLPWTTLRDALADVPEPTPADDSPGWPNHKAIPGARTYPKHTGSPLDLPSKTIKAGVHGVSGGEAMLRELDGTVRYLSVRESALVQGFPTDYAFPGARSRVMGVIGNAVAVDVAATVGGALREHTNV